MFVLHVLAVALLLHCDCPLRPEQETISVLFSILDAHSSDRRSESADEVYASRVHVSEHDGFSSRLTIDLPC